MLKNIKKRRTGRKKSKRTSPITMNPHQLPSPYRSPSALRFLFNELLLDRRMVFNIIPQNSPRRFHGLQRSGTIQNQNATYHEILASRALTIFLILRNIPQIQLEVSHPKLETLSYDVVKIAHEKQCFSESFRFHFLPKT